MPETPIEKINLDEFEKVMGEMNRKRLEKLYETETAIREAIEEILAANEENDGLEDMEADIRTLQQKYHQIIGALGLHTLAFEEASAELEKLGKNVDKPSPSPASNSPSTPGKEKKKRSNQTAREENISSSIPGKWSQPKRDASYAPHTEALTPHDMRSPERSFDKDRHFGISPMSSKNLNSMIVEGSVNMPYVNTRFFITHILLPTPGGYEEKIPTSSAQRKVPSLEEWKGPSKKSPNLRVVLPGTRVKRLLPVTLGYTLVASNIPGLVVADPDEAFPFGTRIIATEENRIPDEVTYYLQKIEKKNFERSPAFAEVSEEERAYWQKNFPIPRKTLALCEKYPEAELNILAQLFVEEFRYVCDDQLGTFLQEHKDEEDMIIQTLKVGHCDYLARLAAIYFRQRGKAAVVAHVRVTENSLSSTSRNFYARPGHAIVLLSIDGKIFTFDPAAACWKFEEKDFFEKTIEDFTEGYGKANQKRKIALLQNYRKAIVAADRTHPWDRGSKGKISHAQTQEFSGHTSLTNHAFNPEKPYPFEAMEACSTMYAGISDGNFPSLHLKDILNLDQPTRHGLQHFFHSVRARGVPFTGQDFIMPFQSFQGINPENRLTYKISLRHILETYGPMDLSKPLANKKVPWNCFQVEHINEDFDIPKLREMDPYWYQYVPDNFEFSAEFQESWDENTMLDLIRDSKGKSIDTFIENLTNTFNNVDLIYEIMIFSILCLKAMQKPRLRQRLIKKYKLSPDFFTRLFHNFLNGEIDGRKKDICSPLEKLSGVRKEYGAEKEDYVTWRRIVTTDPAKAAEGRKQFRILLQKKKLQKDGPLEPESFPEWDGVREHDAQFDDIRDMDVAASARSETLQVKIQKPSDHKNPLFVHCVVSYHSSTIFDYLPKLTAILKTLEEYAESENKEVYFGTTFSDEYIKLSPQQKIPQGYLEELAYYYVVEAQEKRRNQVGMEKSYAGLATKKGMPKNLVVLCNSGTEVAMMKETLRHGTNATVRTLKDVGLNLYGELTPAYLNGELAA